MFQALRWGAVRHSCATLGSLLIASRNGAKVQLYQEHNNYHSMVLAFRRSASLATMYD